MAERHEKGWEGEPVVGEREVNVAATQAHLNGLVASQSTECHYLRDQLTVRKCKH